MHRKEVVMPLKPINPMIYTDRALALQTVKSALSHSKISGSRADVFVQKLEMCSDNEIRQNCLTALARCIGHNSEAARSTINMQEACLDAVNENNGKYCSLFDYRVYSNGIEPYTLEKFLAKILNKLGYDKAAANLKNWCMEHFSEPRRLYHCAKQNNIEVPNFVYDKLNALKSVKEIGDEKLWRRYFVEKQVESTQEILNRIYEKYGTKIYFSEPVTDKELMYINTELEMWQKVSGGKAIMPKVIDINTFNTKILVNKAGGMAHGDTIYAKTAKIIPNYNHGERYSAIRHEMTHINDLEDNVEESAIKYLLRRFLSIKESEKVNKELENAGLGKQHGKYFYKNYFESKAVFAEGNMSKYSEEFKKEMVKRYHLPEWILNLKDIYIIV